ncbi:hypothetical protein E2C01_013955 [Portunus trituberculatus]|uniref:Secreted protein n=1 Tax=Portunus trituberculatus TaxID=210409 RepID=A0A5B7DIQ4_PORTR|nr:hypothetical protein [Portunus trituberculatus]
MPCLFACLQLLAVSQSLFLVNSRKLRHGSASKYTRVTSPLFAPLCFLGRTTQQRDQRRVPVKNLKSHQAFSPHHQDNSLQPSRPCNVQRPSPPFDAIRRPHKSPPEMVSKAQHGVDASQGKER